MALASTTQDDWGGGIYRGRRAPQNSVYDAVNVLINDEGLVIRRGGSEYKTAADVDTLADPLVGIADVFLGGVARTLAWGLGQNGLSQTALYTVDDAGTATAIPTIPGGYVRPFARGVGIGDSWFVSFGQIAGTYDSLLGYDGTTASITGSLPPSTVDFVTAVGTPARLVVTSGNRAYFSDRGAPLTMSSDSYHELPQNAQIIGADSLADNLVLFSTTGVWVVSNMALDPVDDFGNIQQDVAQVSKNVMLWGDSGVAAWQGGFVVPAVDDVFLFSLSGEEIPVSTSIRPLYRSYVKEGYQPGLAAVHRGHYFLPVVDHDSAFVDLLVCRVDRDSAWTRWSGNAASVAYAQRIGAATRTPKLLAVQDAKVTDLTGCFDPASSNAADADGTAPTVTLTTRDYPTGGNQRGFAQRARLRYELTIPDPLGASWTADPWDISNAGLETVSGQIAGSTSTSASRSWLNTGTQTVTLTTSTLVEARPAANVDTVAYSALGFVQAPGTSSASGYEARFRYETASDTVAIYRYDNTLLTRILDPVALPSRIARGDTIRVVVAAGVVTAYVNSTNVGSVASTTYFNAGQAAYATMGISDFLASPRSAIRHALVNLAIEVSSDQDAGVFTALTDKGEQGGGTGWGASDGSLYQWATVGKKRERIRFRVTLTGACSSFVLRSLELLLRASGRQ